MGCPVLKDPGCYDCTSTLGAPGVKLTDTLVCRCSFLRRSSALQLLLQPQIWP